MRDRGLQPERTALAWLRTGIVTTVLALATLALAVRRPAPVAPSIAALAALAAAGAVAVALVTGRQLQAGLSTGRSPWPHLAWLVTASALLAISGATLALS